MCSTRCGKLSHGEDTEGDQSIAASNRPLPVDKGLKGGSLGLVAVIVIGVASTAPGYSLAASIGLVTGEAGAKAPFIMLFAFVPMACIAAAFYYLNKADPDCGTNFTWGVRAFGPKAGWIAGWGCIVADLVIMPNLAGVSGQYLVLLFDETGGRQHLPHHLHRDPVHHRHDVDLLEGHRAVGSLAGAAARHRAGRAGGVRGRRHRQVARATASQRTVDGMTYHSIKPSLSWMSPSGLNSSAIIAGLVVAVFIYWGWDTCVSVNEEAKDSQQDARPRRGAVARSCCSAST